jgi:4-hydroxy-tetrahydrodipicolinate synthase
MVMTVQLKGVFCAALTPLRADLAPDHAVFVEHCRGLLAQGCDGIALLGTTGEANSLAVAERKALLESVTAAGIAPTRLLPGTGVSSLTETVELTRQALALGVTTVLMLPPFYYKNITDEGMFASYSEIVERIADPRLRIVLYHIPQMSYQPISHSLIARLLSRYPATFIGIKDSSGDFANMTAMIDRFPDLAVLTGADPLLLPLLRKGGAGCITATSNLVGRDLAFIFRHYNDADRTAEIEAAQQRVVGARERASMFAQIASLKTLLADATGHPGWRRLRPPLTALSAAEAEKLLEIASPALAGQD